MLRVLIVDDDVVVGQCLSALIPWKELGYEVVAVALDGEEGFAMALEHNPDVIISDIVMPVMDGSTLCQRISETMSDVTFIFLSAYEDFATAQLALRYHVKDYILKPIDRQKIEYLSKLLADMRAALDRNRFYCRLLCDKEMEADILGALARADTAYFSSMFHEIAKDATGGADVNRLQEAASRLLLLLHDFQESRGVRRDAAEQKQALAELSGLRFKMDIIFFLSERYFDVLRAQGGVETSYYKSLMGDVIAYIDEHAADPCLNVASVASAFNYSPDYLSRLFSGYAEDTMSGYIAQRRLHRAAELLLASDASVADVSRLSGYPDASYFARAFKRKYGVTPRAYRERHGSVKTGKEPS